jgi:ABC-2 type transport system permease protein
MDKIFLWFINLVTPVLQKMGIDTYQLYQILKIKLMMDDRRPNTMFAAKRGFKTSTTVRSPLMVNIFMLIMGGLIGLTLFLNQTPYLGQTLYFFIFMVLMSLTLISDFTSVLIDTREQFILLPRPVSDRTIAVSRIMHISFYVLRLALLQGLPGMIMVGFIDGPLAVPIFFIQILAATFLSIFMVNIIYLLLMRSVSPQRFKDIISYFQIGFSVLIFGSYYLLPRLIDVKALQNIDLISQWWAPLIPSVWIAAINELFIHVARSGFITVILAMIGLLLPIFGLWLVAKVLAPGFNRRLAIIATSDGNSTTTANVKKTGNFAFLDKIGNIAAPDPVENAGFKITWKLSARTREFKLKVFPSFAYVPIYFLYFVLNTHGNLNEKLDKMRNGHSYVFLIYLCTFILVSILSNISMSEKYKSAWVYYALPIGEPGKILSGMYKAIILVYFLPYCLIIGAAVVAVWGPQAINDIILAILVSIIYGMLVALFTIKGLPFSKPVINKQGGGKMISSLIMLAFIGGVGFVHYLVMKWETLIWILIIPFFIINLVMFHYYKKQTWDNIEVAEV